MKKLLSIVLSVVMLVSVCAVSTIPAMAKVVASPGQTTTKKATVSVEVNGSTSSDVTYKKDNKNDNQFTFDYNGTGNVDSWEFPGMTEGVDYEVIDNGDNTITIVIINENYTGEIKANAIVKEKTTAKDTKVTTTKKNSNSGKSPKTGAVASTGIVVAGAGVAILSALKKKSDAE